MVDPERLDPEAVKSKGLLLLRDLLIKDLEGQLRRDHAQGVHHAGQALRADQKQRLRPLRISHG